MDKLIKLKTEAEKCGLVLIGPAAEEHTSDPANYRSYKLPCGCVQDIQTTHVRRNNYSCKVCNEKKFNEALSFYNFYVEDELQGDVGYVLVGQKDCEHKRRLYRGKILNKQINSCPECTEDNLKNLALSKGLLYKSRESPKGGQFRTFIYVACGHEKYLQPGTVRKGNHICQICIDDRYEKEADESGVKYLRDSEPIGIKRNYLLPCGHEKYLRVEHIRLNRWTCHICEENQYTKPSGVYLLHITENNFSWLKLGYSAKLDNRVSVYGLSKEATVEVLSYKNVENGLFALHKEKEIHAKYKKQRLSKHLMKQYHKYNGGSECYPVELKEDLIIEIENI